MMHRACLLYLILSVSLSIYKAGDIFAALSEDVLKSDKVIAPSYSNAKRNRRYIYVDGKVLSPVEDYFRKLKRGAVREELPQKKDTGKRGVVSLSGQAEQEVSVQSRDIERISYKAHLSSPLSAEIKGAELPKEISPREDRHSVGHKMINLRDLEVSLTSGGIPFFIVEEIILHRWEKELTAIPQEEKPGSLSRAEIGPDLDTGLSQEAIVIETVRGEIYILVGKFGPLDTLEGKYITIYGDTLGSVNYHGRKVQVIRVFSYLTE